LIELKSIYITSGVNEKGEGFLTINVHGKEQGKDVMMLGQLPPDEVRKLALSWLESAEAADQDAAVLRCIRKLELPEQLAGMVITELRESRE
jgi:hypothetical protein